MFVRLAKETKSLTCQQNRSKQYSPRRIFNKTSLFISFSCKIQAPVILHKFLSYLIYFFALERTANYIFAL